MREPRTSKMTNQNLVVVSKRSCVMLYTRRNMLNNIADCQEKIV